MGPVRRLGFLLAALVLLAASPLLRLLLRAVRTGESGPLAETLVVVSPHWEGIRYEIGRAFEQKLAATGRRVRIEWLNPGGTSACLRFVKSRFAAQPAGGIGVDVFFGGGVEPHLDLAQAGLLDPVTLDPATLEAIAPSVAGVAVYDARAGWYGTCLTTFGIVYNKPLLARLGLPEPTQFSALGEPQARGWVGLADPRQSGTVHMIYELILQSHGWEEGYRLLARMAGNSRRIYYHAAEVPNEIAGGEVAMGTTLDSYAFAQVAMLGRDAIGFTAPEGETVMNPDAIAVLRGAPHKGLARELINFTLSWEGQALWMLPRNVPGGPERYALGRLPVRPDVWKALREQAAVTLDPFAARTVLRYDPALGSRRWAAINGLIGAAFIDLHRELARTWGEVIDAGRPAEAEELLTRPPLDAAELARIDAQDLRDPFRRDAVLARWSREAHQRYQRAAAIARAAKRGRS